VPHCSGMAEEAQSYAAIWRELTGLLATGKVVLGPDALRLEGATRQGQLSRREIPYAELEGVRVGRVPSEMLNGRPTLVLARSSGPSLQIEPFGIGMLSELADLLATLSTAQSERLERLVVIVPLRKGTLERARALVERGPPFDPEQSGLERHEVFFGEREVLFLFEGHQVAPLVEQLVRDPGAWPAALDWRSLLAGPPRLAHSGYTWARASAPT
jgi:hypothetical protein